MAYLWGMFLGLHQARQHNGFGPNPVSWSEIESYCRLMGMSIDPWEAESIRALDDAFLAFVSEQKE